MANAERLDSGSYRCRATATINGKKTTKSFTVSPKEFSGTTRETAKKAKQQAELLAREWQISEESKRTSGKTVGEAMQSYIDNRSNLLSDTTLRGYMSDMRALKSLSDIYIQDIDTDTIQAKINEMSPRFSPKTIRLIFGFLKTSLDYAGIDKKFKLCYPKMQVKKDTAPDHDEVKLLLDNSEGILKTILCLGAFGGLRAGEISAIKQKDVLRDMSMISIHADMIRKKEGGGYKYKDRPKTPHSVRTVRLPKEIIDMIPDSEDPEAFVINVRPDKISLRFRKLRNKLGLDCRFHDLRHYAASWRSDLGMSKKYVKKQLGWSEKSKVCEKHYDDVLQSEAIKFDKISNAFITNNFGEQIKKKA